MHSESKKEENKNNLVCLVGAVYALKIEIVLSHLYLYYLFFISFSNELFSSNFVLENSKQSKV